MTVTNVPAEITVDSVQVHPQKPEMGMRALRKFNCVYLELDDCNTFAEGEEVTLMRWGNFLMDKITKNAQGDVTAIEARFDAHATNFSKTKKITWLAAIPDLVPCQLVEFDHLISQPVIKEGQDFKDFVTPVSRAETSALGDPYLRTTQRGEVVQLERKGFYRCDRPYGGSADKPIVLYLIPDGRVKSMSTLTSALHHR
jgi:glutamyl-tRNA synthetase